MDVRCINNLPLDANSARYPDLKEKNVYFVIGMEGDYYRIAGDMGLPYLYHKSRFEVVNSEHEPDWTTIALESGLLMVYSQELSAVDFFARFFNGDEKARNALYTYLQKIQDRRTDAIYDAAKVNSLIEESYEIRKGKEGKYVVLHTYDKLGEKLRKKVQRFLDRFRKKE